MTFQNRLYSNNSVRSWYSFWVQFIHEGGESRNIGWNWQKHEDKFVDIFETSVCSCIELFDYFDQNFIFWTVEVNVFTQIMNKHEGPLLSQSLSHISQIIFFFLRIRLIWTYFLCQPKFVFEIFLFLSFATIFCHQIVSHFFFDYFEVLL